jgi:hypothetical protein
MLIQYIWGLIYRILKAPWVILTGLKMREDQQMGLGSVGIVANVYWDWLLGW